MLALFEMKGHPMPTITVRNLTNETHRALKLLAKEHGKKMETYVRDLLIEQSRPCEKIGSSLAKYARKHGTIDLKIIRDKTPAKTAIFK
jgi:antitoxin FitA